MALALVPEAIARVLISEKLAESARVTRGAGAVAIEVTTSARALVTLRQDPKTLGRLAQLVSDWSRSSLSHEDRGQILVHQEDAPVAVRRPIDAAVAEHMLQGVFEGHGHHDRAGSGDDRRGINGGDAAAPVDARPPSGGRLDDALAGSSGDRALAVERIIADVSGRLKDADNANQRADLLLQLGLAYRARRAMDPGADLERATEFLRESVALRGDTRDLGWVLSRAGLAKTLRLLRSGDVVANFAESAQLLRDAIAVAEQLGQPRALADVQAALGATLTFMPASDIKPNILEAIRQFRRAQSVRTRAVAPHRWAILETNIATALLKMPGDRACGGDTQSLHDAVRAAANALSVFELDRVPAHRRRAANTRGFAEVRLGHWSDAAISFLIAWEAAQTLAIRSAEPAKELADASNAPINAAYALLRAEQPLCAALAVESVRRPLWSRTDPVTPQDILQPDEGRITGLAHAVAASGRLVYVVPTRYGAAAAVLTPDSDPSTPNARVVTVDGYTTDDIRLVLHGQEIGQGHGGHDRGAFATAQRSDNPYRLPPLEALRDVSTGLQDIGDVVRSDNADLVVCGPLGIFPLHAEWLGTETPETASPRVFRYAPSATTFLRPTQRSRSRSMRLLSVGVNDSGPGRTTLDYAEREAEAIASVGFHDVVTLIGRDATPANILAELPGATHVHIATHGTLYGFGDGRPGVYCADGEVLDFRRVVAADCSSIELFTVSACWLGLHDILYLPDAVDGVSTALLRSGVTGVVAPSWEIDDLDAALFMVRLYTELFANEGAARATGAAQRWLRWADATELAQFRESHGLWGQDVGATSQAAHPPTSHDTWASFRYIGAELGLKLGGPSDPARDTLSFPA